MGNDARRRAQAWRGEVSAVYGYCRVSSVKQIEGTSLDAQAGQIVARFPNARLYRDEGVSGSIALFDRPQGKLLNAELVKGDTLVLTKVDRGFRSIADFANTVDALRKRGILLAVLDLNGGAPLGDDKFAQLLLTILVAFAQLERQMIAERTSEGRAQRIVSNHYVGGSPPFGHHITDNGVLVQESWYPELVALVHELRHRQSQSLRAIQREIEVRWAVRPSLPTLSKIIEGSPIHNGMEIFQ